MLHLCRDELKQVVTSDLQRLLGVEGEPVFVKYVEFGIFFTFNHFSVRKMRLSLIDQQYMLIAAIYIGTKHFHCMTEAMTQSWKQ